MRQEGPDSGDKPLGIPVPNEEALMFRCGESAPTIATYTEQLSVQAVMNLAKTGSAMAVVKRPAAKSGTACVSLTVTMFLWSALRSQLHPGGITRLRALGQRRPSTETGAPVSCLRISYPMSNTLIPSSQKTSGLRRPPHGNPQSLSARVRKGVLWNILTTLLLRVANISITAVVAHILAPRDFGVFAVALTAYTIIGSLSELGLASCLIRADLDIDAIAPTMVTVSLVMSAIAGEVMALFAEPIAAALGSANGAGSVRVMALAVLVTGLFAVPSAQLTRDFKQYKLFWANVISLVSSTAVLLILAKSGSGAIAFAWSRVIAQLTMGCVMVLCVPKNYRPGISRSALSILFRFGLPLAGANFVNYILLNVDYAFVGHLIGPVALGVYVLAFNVASWPAGLLGGVINNVSMPAFSRVKHDPDLLKNAMGSALRAVSLILMPMSSMMVVLAGPLVLTLYGPKWAASAKVLSILSLYGAISIICVLFANMLTSLGKAKLVLIVQLVWLGALVPAMALGVHWNGIVGAAIAHIAVIGPLVLPSYLFALKRTTGVRFSMLGKAILPSLLAASAAALAARATASQSGNALVQLVTGLGVGGLVYVVAAAPQGVAWLSQEQATRLRALRLFRLYKTAARIVRLPASLKRSGLSGRDY
jgi:lipopolysaccharide exporter